MLAVLHLAGWVGYAILAICLWLSYLFCERYFLLLKWNGNKIKELQSQVKSFVFSSKKELQTKIYHILLNEQEPLQRYKKTIQTLVMVAPLLGLLGTVIGMIETFESLGGGQLYSSSGGIAGGISQALITTQMGLLLSIPGVFASRYLNRKQQVIEIELEKIKEMALIEFQPKGEIL